MSAIKADYRTNKHVPSRKCYQLIMEVAEEEFPEICQVLGYPKTGESTYVGIALLDMKVDHNPDTTMLNIMPTVYSKEQTEGEKLRTKAVLLCKDEKFQLYVKILDPLPSYTDKEINARDFLCRICDIKSRSELKDNIGAQIDFIRLMREFEAWKLTQTYSDNLERE